MAARPKPWRGPRRLRVEVEPLTPRVERRFRYPGRKRHDDRACLEGILYVLRHGLPWRALPPPAGGAPGPDLLAAPGRVGAGRGLEGVAGAPAAAAGRGRADRLVAGDRRCLPGRR